MAVSDHSAARAYIEDRSIPIPEAGCWLWLLSFGSHGYGNACAAGERVAHRVAFVAFVGAIPAGMLVQHTCDNKWCVAPHHLRLGTDATNAFDKQMKGRAARRLTVEVVREIRRRVIAGAPVRTVARAFSVSQRLVQRIRDNRIWQHVPVS